MKVFVRCFTLIELLVVTSHLCCDRSQSVSQKKQCKESVFFTCPWAGEPVPVHLN